MFSIFLVAAAAMEFSKPNKPKVRYTRPWGPPLSTKPTNRVSCKEAHSTVYPSYSVSRKVTISCIPYIKTHFLTFKFKYICF